MLKPIIFGTTICTMLPLALYGCTGSGSIANPSISIGGGLIHVQADEITWGEAQTPPAGLIEECDAVVNGHPITIFTDPETGSKWFRDSDGDYHRVIVGGDDLDCTGGLGGVRPVQKKSGRLLRDNDLLPNSPISYSFDQTIDFASAQFILPLENIENYIPASEMPFMAQETSSLLPNGDMTILYSGTINDVLGSLWWIGIEEVEFVDENGVTISIQWANTLNVVSVETSLGAQTLTMVPTDPDNMPF